MFLSFIIVVPFIYKKYVTIDNEEEKVKTTK
jgi:hypothetical protein